jgi:hypothetical protein
MSLDVRGGAMTDNGASGADGLPPGSREAGATRHKAKVLGALALLALGAVMVIASLDDGSSDLAPPELLVEESPIAAHLSCQEFPATNLRTPSMADSPSYGEAIDTPRGGQWVVEAHVETEDGLRAMPRGGLLCAPPE